MIQSLTILACRIIRAFYSIFIVLPILLIGNIFARTVLFFERKGSKEVLSECNSKLRETNNLAFSYIKESFCGK
jgi:hypothetical protein